MAEPTNPFLQFVVGQPMMVPQLPAASGVHKQGHLQDWLDGLYQKTTASSPEEGIDYLYDWVLDTLDANDTSRCDELLVRVDESQLNAPALVALLAITVPFRSVLQHREDFFRRVKSELSKDHADDELEAILKGLD